METDSTSIAPPLDRKVHLGPKLPKVTKRKPHLSEGMVLSRTTMNFKASQIRTAHDSHTSSGTVISHLYSESTIHAFLTASIHKPCIHTIVSKAIFQHNPFILSNQVWRAYELKILKRAMPNLEYKEHFLCQERTCLPHHAQTVIPCSRLPTHKLVRWQSAHRRLL